MRIAHLCKPKNTIMDQKTPKIPNLYKFTTQQKSKSLLTGSDE